MKGLGWLILLLLWTIFSAGCAPSYQPGTAIENTGPWSVDEANSSYYESWQNEAGR